MCVCIHILHTYVHIRVCIHPQKAILDLLILHLLTYNYSHNNVYTHQYTHHTRTMTVIHPLAIAVLRACTYICACIRARIPSHTNTILTRISVHALECWMMGRCKGYGVECIQTHRMPLRHTDVAHMPLRHTDVAHCILSHTHTI